MIRLTRHVGSTLQEEQKAQVATHLDQASEPVQVPVPNAQEDSQAETGGPEASQARAVEGTRVNPAALPESRIARAALDRVSRAASVRALRVQVRAHHEKVQAQTEHRPDGPRARASQPKADRSPNLPTARSRFASRANLRAASLPVVDSSQYGASGLTGARPSHVQQIRRQFYRRA